MFPFRYFLFIHNLNLTHLHCVKCVFVACGRDTGAAFRIDCNRYLGECRFDEHRVGNDANIGAAGFLLCSKPNNTVGNKAIWHIYKGNPAIANYFDSNGYLNYQLLTKYRNRDIINAGINAGRLKCKVRGL